MGPAVGYKNWKISKISDTEFPLIVHVCSEIFWVFKNFAQFLGSKYAFISYLSKEKFIFTHWILIWF